MTQPTPYMIEKNVPLPAKLRGGVVAIMRLMEAGDSFPAPGKKASDFSSLARRLGMKIATRREGDGVRVWCLEPASESAAR